MLQLCHDIGFHNLDVWLSRWGKATCRVLVIKGVRGCPGEQLCAGFGLCPEFGGDPWFKLVLGLGGMSLKGQPAAMGQVAGTAGKQGPRRLVALVRRLGMERQMDI